MSQNERRPPPSPRQDTFRFGGQNSHQNFDFRGPNGHGPSFPSTSGQNRDRFRGRDRPRGNSRGRGRGPWKRFNASDREIFRARRSPTPERMAGMNGSDSRFRVLEDLSESESESDPDNTGLSQLDGTGASRDNSHSDDMDMSSEDEHPRAKRARTTNGASTDTEDAKPKWSNPDPYTALPPPSQTDGPKKDVVAMIRKAKVENAGPSEQTSKADDFISLNFDDAGNEREEGEDPSDSDHQSSEVHDRAPNHPRGQRMDHTGPPRATNVATDRWPAQEATHTYFDRHGQDMQRRSRSPARDYDRDYNAHQSRRDYRVDRAYDTRDMYDEYPARYNAHAPPAQYDDDDDYAPPPARPYNNDYGQSQASQPVAGKRKRREGANDVSGSYLPAAYSDNTPWMGYCQVQSSNTGEWLHDEIRAFHEYVRPRTYERTMREELIKRVNDAFKLKYHHVTVHPFGSFATDLYLPVSDMDLVAVSTTYMQSGYPEIGQSKKDVRVINGTVIERGGLSRSSQLILGAKVPIIKFTDIPTGIHVDVSFENDSGLRAVPVVEEWIRRYPSIPHLVYPIKHLLASHDLNDVSTGGLGGFSIICLVVFSLHHLEGQHSRDFIFDNLEVALMNFLGYFGNEFDYRLQGLDMGNMRKIQKISFRGDRRPQPQRLLIVDPNNPANDVSGGTGKIPAIFRLFSETHKRLRSQMELAGTLYRETGQRPSILKSMLDSGFDSYEYQRGRLRQRHDNLYGGRDNDVQYVSSRSLGTGRSQNDAIDLTSADGPSVRGARKNLRGGDQQSNKQSRKARQRDQGQTNSTETTNSYATAQPAPLPTRPASLNTQPPPHVWQLDGHMSPRPDVHTQYNSVPSTHAGITSQTQPVQHSAFPPVNSHPAPINAQTAQTVAGSSGPSQSGKKLKRRQKKKEKNSKSAAAVPKPPAEQKAKVSKRQKKKVAKASVDSAKSKDVKGKPVEIGDAARQRVTTFKNQFPDAACPTKLTKRQYKALVDRQSGSKK